MRNVDSVRSVQARERWWLGAIGRWKKSGLSQREFCKREGIPEWKFSDWKRRLRQVSCSRQVDSRRHGGVEFAPVILSDRTEDYTAVDVAPVTAPTPAIEIVVVRIPAGSDGQTVRAVLEAMSTRC